MKKIKYDDIKTPKTVEEFRENLKKYFICTGNDWSTRNELMLQGNNRVKIDELKSLSDLYSKCDSNNPMIVPYVEFDTNSITNDETIKNMFSRNFEDVMKDESRFKIADIDSVESHSEFMSNAKVMWIGLDNQIYRSFFYKTLGEFSGYIGSQDMSNKIDALYDDVLEEEKKKEVA